MALEYAGGTHTLTDVIEQVWAGHMQFWPGERSDALRALTIAQRRRAA